jgi:RNA polymerase sigma factor (TIGR02999 family)
MDRTKKPRRESSGGRSQPAIEWRAVLNRRQTGPECNAAMGDVTRILADIDRGNAGAADQLLPLVYEELRKLAAGRLAHEAPAQTLQATALVHEAYLRLVDGSADLQWNSRGHFFAAAAEAMRRILVERARQKASLKGGGRFERLDLGEVAAPGDEPAGVDLLDLNEALLQLEREEPQKAELVKLRFFAGLSLEETAKALGISVATAKRYWAYARARLYGKINRK